MNIFVIKNQSVYTLKNNKFKCKILSYKINGSKLSFNLKCKEKLVGSYYIKSEEEKNYLINNLKNGREIIIKGLLTKPLNNTIPNTFNYREYLENQNIFYILNIEEYEIRNNNLSMLYKIKNIIENRIELATKSKKYLKMFILGNKNDLDYDTYTNYQKLGVSHLFAISGMHLSIFSSVLHFFIKKLIKKESISFLVVSLFLFLYTLLVSMTASVVRAFVSFVTFGINRLFNLKIKSTTLMLVVLLIVLLINYKFIYHIAFQYSYLCSFGIILFNPIIKKYNNYFVKLIIISFIATLFSLPITAINFYEINILSVFSNLIFVPLITFIIYPLTLITLIVPFLDNVLYIFIKLLELLSNLTLNFLVFEIIIPKVHYVYFLIYYLILYLVIKTTKKMLIVLIFWIILIKLKPFLNPNDYVYFLDVGQGDSVVIKSAYNKEVIMIDTGGKVKFKQEKWQEIKETTNMSNSITTFLKSIGSKKVDLLILTHGDADHLGYALDIIDKIKVSNIIINKGDVNDLEKQIYKTNLVVDKYKSKEINYHILETKDYVNENDNSIVSLFNINNIKFLFMGDVSKKVELDIINKYKFEIDVLKLGHHGSKTSSDIKFIENINPKLSIISAGRNNRYNHPSVETLETLHELDIDYLNTSTSGTICFEIREIGRAHV